ncbi:hypothetical protein [Teredinibacter haidensis]|mgnify:CR=1 FL=1|uniref:hypothetical protein n=1 Tax=Teredinibacter haidensis TaxID=2731755 RepID=UPI000948A26A|nr:hypothetical protein [Teredinibacter haidensis]
MKPRTPEAMKLVLEHIRQAFPLGSQEASVCQSVCVGCPKKLLGYLESEVENWQNQLSDGDVPNLGDIHKLGKTSRKIYKVLQINNLVESE